MINNQKKTLRESMIEILSANKTFMEAEDIANKINQSEIYRRKNGGLVTASQIKTQARKYQMCFRRIDTTIGLA